MMADSTNVERPGYTMSERIVGETFDRIFGKAKEELLLQHLHQIFIEFNR